MISIPRRAYSSAAISAFWTYRQNCHLCPTRYSFSPESSEAFESEVPCPRTQHWNNVPRLGGEKHHISLKILHQAGFESARQAATSPERHALTIAPCPSRPKRLTQDKLILQLWRILTWGTTERLSCIKPLDRISLNIPVTVCILVLSPCQRRRHHSIIPDWIRDTCDPNAHLH